MNVHEDRGLMAAGGLSPRFSTSSTRCHQQRQQEEEEEGGVGGRGTDDGGGNHRRRSEMTWQPHLLQRRGRMMGAPPLGLRNLGNTCYLNSVLQCLTYTPPLANFCLQFHHSSICEKQRQQRPNSDDGKKKRDCPFCVLERRIARSLSLDAPSDVPSKVSSCLRLYASHFQWGHQEDAHEFLRYVIDSCHNTCLALKEQQQQSQQPGGGGGVINKKSGNRISSDNGSSREKTVVEDIFGGALLSQVRCLSCGSVSNKTDEIMDVSLDLFQSRSLNDALRRFFQPEFLDGDNKYNCSRCNKLSAAKKRMLIQKAPNVLVIQLKRFEGIHRAKINRDIMFEEVLSLSNFMSTASQDPEPVYNLFGSIVHSGCSPDSGHYYAYVKDPSERWYCCNDSNVSLSSSQEVLSEKVYILFYLRSDQAPKTVKPGPPCNDQKLPESNGNHIGIPKPLIVAKATGEFEPHSERIPLSVAKNGKVATSQPVKFGFKNFQKNNYLMQEDRNLKCSTDEKINRGNDSKQHPFSEKNSAVSTATGTKNSAALNSHDMPNGGVQANVLSHSDGQLASGDASLKHTVDNLKIAQGKADGFIKSKTQSALPDDIKESRSNGPHVLKRKGMLNAGDSAIPDSNWSMSDIDKEDASYASYSILADKLSPKGLASIIERISSKARITLQSCGWTDEVHDLMRAQKRRCVRAAGCPPDHTELRRLLIADARKKLNSHIPQELKEDLVKDLRQSFLERDS